MSSKRQTTMAKMKREQAVRERRVRKQEKKDERKRAAAELKASGGVAPVIVSIDSAGNVDIETPVIEVEAPVIDIEEPSRHLPGYASRRSSSLDAAALASSAAVREHGQRQERADDVLARVDDLGDLQIDAETGEHVRVFRRQRVPPPEVGDHGAHRVLCRRVEVGTDPVVA